MTLRELLAVWPQNHRDVREGGYGRAQGLVDHDLARGVGEVVVAADHVRDAHHGIVHHGGKVVGGGAVGAEDDEVIQLAGVEGHVTVDRIVDHHVATVEGNLDAQGVGLARVDAAPSLGGVDVAAGALVALEGVVARLGGSLVGRELLRRAEARIGLALVPQALRRVAVELHAVGLAVGAKVAAHLRTLVPVEAQPAHGTQDDLGVLLGRAGWVRVVDAQDEGAVVRAGKCPVVDCGASPAHVELSGGGGREAHAHVSVVCQGGASH